MKRFRPAGGESGLPRFSAVNPEQRRKAKGGMDRKCL